jgi:uncharacterized UPF0160 family protein
MWSLSKKIQVITHDSHFHADDVCAIASLSLLYGNKMEVTRTRDPKIIEQGDIILDVGGKYDHERFFDHHQIGGAGKRENDIPYAAFGLIWKRFGKEIVGSEAVAKRFDDVFVQSIDANDNGVSTFETKFPGVYPFKFDSFVFASNPTWKEDSVGHDEKFFETVEMFKKIIAREILFLQHEDEAREKVLAEYNQAEDKRIIILTKHYPVQGVLSSLPEPLFFIYPRDGGLWGARAVRDDSADYKNRKDFPASWAGKRDSELVEITGVPSAVFCHNGRFMVVASSKEGIIALVKRAVEA